MILVQRGFIKLWRKIYDSPDHPINQSRPFTEFEAWIDLIMLANFEEKDWNGISLKRGELCMSLQSLASRWRWAKSKVKRFLDRYGKRNAIETVSETITTRITIINYNAYNPDRNAIETVSETQPVRQAEPTKRILKNKEPKEKDSLVSSKKQKKQPSANGKLKKSQKIFPEDSYEFMTAKAFWDFKSEDYPPENYRFMREANLQEWAGEIERLKRIDGKSEKTIDEVLEFALNDDFWSENLRALSVIRKKNKEHITKFEMIEQKWKRYG